MTSFILKFIVSPLIFSFTGSLDKKVIISEILNRFEKFTTDSVFKKLEEQLYKKYTVRVNISPESITKEINRIFDIVTSVHDKLYIDVCMAQYQKNNFVRFSYSDIQKHDLSSEQIIKIILLENNYKKNGKIVKEELKTVKDFSDIPDEINKIFGLEQKKYDTTNLIRYVKENFKDDQNLSKMLSICELINESYYNLKNHSLDLTSLPENFLKAICNWDAVVDSKIQSNYNHYIQKISKSSLNKTLCIAMLSNIGERKTSDFFESLAASNL